MKRNISGFQLLRNYRKTKTCSCEACIFREASKLNGTCLCSLALINAVWYIFRRNICFISRIVDDHCSYLQGIINPYLKLILCDRGTCRIIWKTKINNIRCILWKLRHKIVLLCTWHINDIRPFLCSRIICTGTSCHCIGIYIYRINRITDSNLVILTENISDITRITLCSVTDKNLIGCNIASSVLIILLCDHITQKLISQIRCISLKCLLLGHLINRTVKSVDYSRCQWQCHIPNTKADNILVRICLAVCCYLFGNC